MSQSAPAMAAAEVAATLAAGPAAAARGIAGKAKGEDWLSSLPRGDVVTSRAAWLRHTCGMGADCLRSCCLMLLPHAAASCCPAHHGLPLLACLCPPCFPCAAVGAHCCCCCPCPPCLPCAAPPTHPAFLGLPPLLALLPAEDPEAVEQRRRDEERERDKREKEEFEQRLRDKDEVGGWVPPVCHCWLVGF